MVETGALTTTYSRDSSGRITRILAPVPPGTVTATGRAVTCPDGPVSGMDKGCRDLRITYGAGTDGTPLGQVKTITAELYDPAVATMVSVPVAAYTYDATNKRLTSVTDPRNGLTTTYGYGSGNELTSIASSGQSAITLGYTTLDSRLKLTTVTRAQALPLTGTATLTRIVYKVNTLADGLPDLSSGAVGGWAQTVAPTYAAAVFGPDYAGAVDPTTGPSASSDWVYADLSYTDASGYTVNTASYGAGAWQRTATDYDSQGNVIGELDAAAIGQIAAPNSKISASQASLYGTSTAYNADIKNTAGDVITPAGTLVTDTYGPLHDATSADGTVQAVRAHTHTDYDQGAPNSGINPATGVPWRLETSVMTTAADSGGNDLTGQTVSSTTNAYTAVVAGTADGWALGTPTQVTTGGITHTTAYDSVGRTVQTRQPLSSGTDAGTTLSSYYTADAASPDAACGNKPEWAGLPCRTSPAGVPNTGPTMPDATTTGYSLWLTPTTTLETSGSSTRTVTTSYDSSGRQVSTETTSNIAGTTHRPGTFTSYVGAGSNGAGQVAYAGVLNGAKTDAETAGQTKTSYDAWGRPTATTTDDGATATAYDSAGQVATVTDPKGTTVYTYDGNGTGEHRGLVTGLTITRGGSAGILSYGSAYDENGNLTKQTLPGAVSQLTSYDLAGNPTSRTYTGQVTPVTESTDPNTGEVTYTPGTPQQDQPWLAWTDTSDIAGRVRSEITGAGAATDGTPGVTNINDVKAP